MSNIPNFIVFILFLMFSEQSWSQSEYSDIESTPVDTVLYQPGFFSWDENTVITSEDGRSLPIFRYQQILDHTNVDFSGSPQSLILLTKDSVVAEFSHRLIYIIEISQDTIHVTAPSEKIMEKALTHLHRMKMDAENVSPDYGLIYLRCGLYLTNNF